MIIRGGAYYLVHQYSRMDLSRKMASFEKEYPQIGKPLASVFKFVGGRVSANT
jgi:hypothetical protein